MGVVTRSQTLESRNANKLEKKEERSSEEDLYDCAIILCSMRNSKSKEKMRRPVSRLVSRVINALRYEDEN
tara:strand:+ start:77 stop:289 length:213 start_codon:yes stop_codon:yes gene_type:complete